MTESSPIPQIDPLPPQNVVNAAVTTAQLWLGMQCSMIQGVSRGLLLRVSADGKTARVEGSWPELMTVEEDLVIKVLLVAERGRVHVEECGGDEEISASIRIFHPIVITGPGEARLVAVLEMSGRDTNERKTVAKLLRWNSEWLQFALAHEEPQGDQNLASVFSMALACLDQQEFRATATALVTELVGRFACQRVSLGLRKGKHMEVQVVSHSARFKQETNLIQAIGAAMDEAVDQDRVITFPEGDVQSSSITQAHAQLAGQAHHGALCTLPISEGEEIIGALTLERRAGQPLSPAEIQTIEQVAAVVSPVLSLRYRDERSLPVKAWHSLKDTLRRLFGPAHIRMKIAALAATLLLVFFSFTQGTWRVTADALVEGSVQRTIAAPIDGYIASVEARAGDVVSAGQQMGALDDNDLRLQRLKWSTLRQQMISESREAMAQHDRAEVSIVNARIEQADAELELIDEQLSRTVLLAPYDGLVIEGDLSQLLGTPVTRGETLFKVAPLDDYRIVLNVDEQDIAPVQVGQGGKLILASMPGRTLALRVEKVTPVSTAEGGRNFFRVEASLVDADLSLQPGMEGVGKIEVGEANLFWIWTRDLGNWIRLKAWTWWR